MGGDATVYLDRIDRVESVLYANIFEGNAYFSEGMRGVLEDAVRTVSCATLFGEEPDDYDAGRSAKFWNGISPRISTLRALEVSDEEIKREIIFSRDAFLDWKKIAKKYSIVDKKRQCLEVYAVVEGSLDCLIKEKNADVVSKLEASIIS